jgi:rhamnosyltransferase
MSSIQKHQKAFIVKIAIAYILYNPDFELLASSIYSIRGQVDSILLVDNGSEKKFEMKDRDVLADQVNLFENTGIANATNIAIDYYRERGYDFLILSDQDSIYAKDYVSILKNNIAALDIKNVAAIVPSISELISNTVKPFYIKKKIWLKKQDIKEKYKPVYQAMASGMIIHLACIEIVGLMKAELFIDYVDFEWCWRVWFSGFRIIAIPALHIYHHLGNYKKTIGKKIINLHSTPREYYITRNTAYLALYSPYLKIIDKYILFFKAVFYLICFPLLSNKPGLSFKYCLLGFFHALSGKLGKIGIRVIPKTPLVLGKPH